MPDDYRFPFGQRVQRVEQADRSPKRVFVLGVYASAVHCTWLYATGRVRVQALAVASEPYPFWRGDGAQEIVDGIEVPEAEGTLIPAAQKFNGPSGIALDEQILGPLGDSRSESWLCDLLPESRANSGQLAAIDREYLPLSKQGIVPPATVPPVPSHFADDARRDEILAELQASGAETLVTLGDVPLREFVAPLSGQPPTLSEYGTADADYGVAREVALRGHAVQLLPLVHPRQAAGLDSYSKQWQELHARWVSRAS